jgi:hypothetical protein
MGSRISVNEQKRRDEACYALRKKYKEFAQKRGDKLRITQKIIELESGLNHTTVSKLLNCQEELFQPAGRDNLVKILKVFATHKRIASLNEANAFLQIVFPEEILRKNHPLDNDVISLLEWSRQSQNTFSESTFAENILQTFSVGGRKVNLIILARAYYGPQEVQCFYERIKHLPPDLEEMRENYERNIEEQKAKGVLGLPYNSPMYKLREFDLSHRHIIEGEEVPILRLKFGPTDYFSQIVTDLNVGDPIREKYLAKATPITEYPVPEFSTILGVNLNLITADNYLVMTERSRHAKVAGNKFHTSVGENLLRPKDSGASYAPDPFLALIRGATEELGITLNKDEIVFRTFTVIPDFCQYSLIATIRIQEVRSQVEEIWHSVIPADKWESRQLLYYPHRPDTIAQFVVSTWDRWFPLALGAVVLSLLDVGYTWKDVTMAFSEAWSKVSL